MASASSQRENRLLAADPWAKFEHVIRAKFHELPLQGDNGLIEFMNKTYNFRRSYVVLGLHGLLLANQGWKTGPPSIARSAEDGG